MLMQKIYFICYKRRQFVSIRWAYIDPAVCRIFQLTGLVVTAHSVLKCMHANVDVLFHPLIYNLTINLNNNRLMSRMLKPPGPETEENADAVVVHKSDQCRC